MLAILGAEGLRRPFVVATMDESWWEAAAELRLPRFFFKKKLNLMRFCLGHELVSVTTKDGDDETIAMAASMYAMGATDMVLADDS